jgi:hypothetical protein
MNQKQLLILLVLVAVVGGSALLLFRHGQSTWRTAANGMGQKLLGDFPVNNVGHINIKLGSNEVNMVKKDDLWRVRERYDYPANYSQISDFLIKAQDLKIVQSLKAGPSQWPKLSLVPGQGTNAALLIDFLDSADKPIKTLLLGKQHFKKSNRPSPMGEMDDAGWPDGRYVKVGANSEDIALISDALGNIEPKPEQWLNKDFIKIDKIKDIAVSFPAATNSWKVSRETETATDWKLADARPTEQLDSSKTSSFSSSLNSPSFSDILPLDAKPAQTGLDKPTLVTLETFDHFTYTLNVGQKTNENYPVAVTVAAQLPKERVAGKDEKPEDKARLDKEFKENQKKAEDKLAQEAICEKWIYLVSGWTLEPLLKERAQLMVEKKEEPKKDEASSTNALSLPKMETSAPSPAATNAPGE